MHDHSCDVVGLFFGWLHHLSCAGRRKIVGIHRLDCRRLLPDTGFACSACLCDVASRDFDACSGFSSPMGPAQADRALDHPNLAVCLGHRRACVFDALQMVSSGTVTVALWSTPHVSANVSVVLLTGKRLQICITPSLALGNYLMFDHTMRRRACERIYGHNCHIQRAG
jgi:hypothetical protein